MTLKRIPSAAALVWALALAGCDYVDFAGPQPSAPAGPPTQEVVGGNSTAGALMPNAEKRLIDTVERLEVGRTRNGALLAAFGSAVETGWFQPALRPLNNGLPGPDGFLEFEFVAAPPELNIIEGDAQRPPVGTPAQRRVKAVRPIPQLALNSAAGVRVFAARGAPTALRFAPAAVPSETEPTRALPPAQPAGPSLPTVEG